MIKSNYNRPLGEDYILQQPSNIYGMFFPVGTEYLKINSDWWYPLEKGTGAILPNYAVNFMVIRNNPSYFKQVSE
jgi:hypothetical protein